MSNKMTTASIHWGMGRVKAGILAHADELNTLDGALGDGDLGITLSRSVERFRTDPGSSDDVGLLLLEYAKLFTGTAGSTYGTLIATGLMAAAKQIKGRASVPWSEMSSLLSAAGAAMAARGKSQLGDKTVLDVIESARIATEMMSDPHAIVPAVSHAVRSTIAKFRPLPFKQGRARIFGDKGIGLEDPGMVAFQRIVDSLLPEGHSDLAP